MSDRSHLTGQLLKPSRNQTIADFWDLGHARQIESLPDVEFCLFGKLTTGFF
jgi:hypothetical protein